MKKADCFVVSFSNKVFASKVEDNDLAVIVVTSDNDDDNFIMTFSLEELIALTTVASYAMAKLLERNSH